MPLVSTQYSLQTLKVPKYIIKVVVIFLLINLLQNLQLFLFHCSRILRVTSRELSPQSSSYPAKTWSFFRLSFCRIQSSYRFYFHFLTHPSFVLIRSSVLDLFARPTTHRVLCSGPHICTRSMFDHTRCYANQRTIALR